jgi:hypothetical protein
MFARYLEHDRRSKQLQWWDLQGLAPRALVPLVVGVICAVASGVAAYSAAHLGVGVGVGLGTGIFVGLAVGLPVRHASRFAGAHPGVGMAGALAGAAIGSIAAGVAGHFGIGYALSIFGSLPEALGVGIGVGASSGWVGGLTGGLLGGFAGALLAGVGVGLPAAVVNGLGCGVAAALATHHVGRREPALVRPTWAKEVGVTAGLVIGVTVGLLAWRQVGAAGAIVLGIAVGGSAAWPFGLRYSSDPESVVATPAAALSRDASAFWRTALPAWLGATAVAFVGGVFAAAANVPSKGRHISDFSHGIGLGLAGGVVVGLTFGFYHAASPSFRVVSWWLALRGRAPWRLMTFFAQARQLGVLRQEGPAYQFRHGELQKRLAETVDAKSD